MKEGFMPKSGLCFNFCSVWLYWKPNPGYETFSDLFPVNEFKGYWASLRSNDFLSDLSDAKNFNTLRQTIVLLCAAVNGEL